jgi:hypothetical protein
MGADLGEGPREWLHRFARSLHGGEDFDAEGLKRSCVSGNMKG